MYPHLHPSGSPSSYIYLDYDQYYSKDGWLTAAPNSWLTFYSLPPRSSSLPQTTVNPKVTILPSHPVVVSDTDTPSSISSHSVLTPCSPFAQHDVGDAEFVAMDFDEFDCDDEDDFLDSDFEMEGVDKADQGPSPLYGALAPHVIKSTSALAGALGDTPSLSYGTHLCVFAPADRRLSASVPGFPSTSRSSASSHQRRTEKANSPAPATRPPPVTAASYPSQHTHTQHNDASSTSLFAPSSPSPYDHISTSSSLAGAFASPEPSAHASRPTSYPLPILQPQPIRPIPPIPLADLTASANDSRSLESPPLHPSKRLRTLSPLPLLCQPVSDAVRYQLHASDDTCYDAEIASEPIDVVTSENDRFAQSGMAFCPEHQSCGTHTLDEKLYSCGRIELPIRWQL